MAAKKVVNIEDPKLIVNGGKLELPRVLLQGAEFFLHEGRALLPVAHGLVQVEPHLRVSLEADLLL